MLPNLCMTASIPALGAAREAVNQLRQRLEVHGKKGGRESSIEKPAAQMRLARADLLARAAERTIRACARENLAIGALDEPEQTPERIRLRAEIAIAVQQCVEAVRTCCEAAGSSIHMLNHPMNRLLRDVQVMQSHVVYDLDLATELHGRALLGLPPTPRLRDRINLCPRPRQGQRNKDRGQREDNRRSQRERTSDQRGIAE
jgi:alkylation response protein AidB-like acyl-CoA dehydrogenase